MALAGIGRILTKGLGIHPERYRPPPNASEDGAYNETESTTKEFLSEIQPTAGGAKRYIRSLFPFWSWIL
jgi:solute carrier family 26 (sodium-independent sulfate anion transporter), member 11